MSTFALIGGTSVLESDFFKTASQHQEKTPYGVVTLLQRDQVWFIQRHGLKTYHPPHRIRHKAHLFALKQLGVQSILALGSVGSLHEDLSPGRWVLPNDFIGFSVYPSFFNDDRGHLAAQFSDVWRDCLLQQLDKLRISVKKEGIYWQARGPRFESVAEIKLMRQFADIVGMTVASELILAQEMELDYAALCIVDNYANGIAGEAVSFERFKKQVHANQQQVQQLLGQLIPRLQAL
ncbi:MTAP family purine nucleoside phosphorylase [Magnetococcales bacterium HHB-1]